MSHINNEAPTPIPQSHKKILWAGCSGYPGALYCCVCSYTIREKPALAYSSDCPNSVCTDCFTEETFCCSRVPQLRVARGVQQLVVREPVADTTTASPDSNPIPPPPPVTEEERIEEDFLAILPEEVLTTLPVEVKTLLLKLRAENATLKKENKTLKHLRDSNLVKLRSNLSAVLTQIDGALAIQLQADTAVISTTSALSSKLDANWREACDSVPEVQPWWNSGKPRPLRYLSYDSSTVNNAFQPTQDAGSQTSDTQPRPDAQGNPANPTRSVTAPPNPSRLLDLRNREDTTITLPSTTTITITTIITTSEPTAEPTTTTTTETN